jgi:hypothetical protein
METGGWKNKRLSFLPFCFWPEFNQIVSHRHLRTLWLSSGACILFTFLERACGKRNVVVLSFFSNVPFRICDMDKICQEVHRDSSSLAQTYQHWVLEMRNVRKYQITARGIEHVTLFQDFQLFWVPFHYRLYVHWVTELIANYEGRLKSSWTGGSAPLLCRGR